MASKAYVLRYWILILSISLGVSDSQIVSQDLRLELRMLIHPPKSLAEWADREDVLRLVLDNTGQEPLSIKVRTIIKRDSQLIAYTRYSDVALMNLEQGRTELGCSSLLSSEAVEFLASIGRCIVRGGVLSPGDYTICCQVLDGANPDLVLLCSESKPFRVSGYELPQLSEPVNYRWITRDRPVLFKWKAIQPSPQVPRIVRYKFLLYESAKGLDPSYVVETLTPILEKFSDNISPLSIVIPLQKLSLSPDHQYVWTVQALDQDSRPYGDPDGMADPFIFRIR